MVDTAFRHGDVVKTTGGSSKRAPKREIKGDWSDWLLVPDRLVWEIFKHNHLEALQRDGPKGGKYSVSSSCVDENLEKINKSWCERSKNPASRLWKGNSNSNNQPENSISEHTICQTLKKMGYSSRKPHHGPHMWAMNSKVWLQFCIDSPNFDDRWLEKAKN